MSEVLSLEEFEEVLNKTADDDLDTLLDVKVDWHGNIVSVAILDTGVIALEHTFFCSECKKNTRVAYICHGAPGWCYVFDRAGNFEADLRDQNFVCDDCVENEIPITGVTIVFPHESEYKSFPGGPPRPGRERLN